MDERRPCEVLFSRTAQRHICRLQRLLRSVVKGEKRVRPGFLRRLPLFALFLCAVAARAAAGVPESAVTLGDVTQSEIRAAKPGHVLRIYPQIGGASSNAKAYRILYRSTGSGGEPIAVSGTVIFPAGPAPREGRNIIAWAHYTTGVAQRCAPTLLPDLSGTIAGLDDMLAHG